MFAVGYVLYQMSLRVDWPRSVYTSPEFRDGSDNEFARTEWELAAMSIVAFADLYPDAKPLTIPQKKFRKMPTWSLCSRNIVTKHLDGRGRKPLQFVSSLCALRALQETPSTRLFSITLNTGYAMCKASASFLPSGWSSQKCRPLCYRGSLINLPFQFCVVQHGRCQLLDRSAGSI
jgi:hypothetical protein